jgi:hypothetical protein
VLLQIVVPCCAADVWTGVQAAVAIRHTLFAAVPSLLCHVLQECHRASVVWVWTGQRCWAVACSSTPSTACTGRWQHAQVRSREQGRRCCVHCIRTACMGQASHGLCQSTLQILQQQRQQWWQWPLAHAELFACCSYYMILLLYTT